MIPELDLHLVPHHSTKETILNFLAECYCENNMTCRIIHGKGNSSKKLQLYRYLEESKIVSGYDDDGSNWGATLIELTKQ